MCHLIKFPSCLCSAPLCSDILILAIFHEPPCAMKTSNFKLIPQPLALFPGDFFFLFDFPSFRVSVWHLSDFGLCSRCSHLISCLSAPACSVHHLRSQTELRMTQALPAPHQGRAMCVHSSHHIVRAHCAFSQSFQLVVELLYQPLTFRLHLHLLTAPSAAHATMSARCCTPHRAKPLSFQLWSTKNIVLRVFA